MERSTCYKEEETEESVVVPSSQAASKIAASVREIRAGKTLSMTAARKAVAKAAAARARMKKRVRA
jgi:hypothetical protein